MSSSGVADCSRAARLVLKDVVSGKLKWIAAPPQMDQNEFDKFTYGAELTRKLDTGRCQITQQVIHNNHVLQTCFWNPRFRHMMNNFMRCIAACEETSIAKYESLGRSIRWGVFFWREKSGTHSQNQYHESRLWNYSRTEQKALQQRQEEKAEENIR